MFNKGKTNQESSKEIGWNGFSGCFWYLVENGVHVCVEKGTKRNGKQVPDLFLANHFTGSLRNDTQSHSNSVFN